MHASSRNTRPVLALALTLAPVACDEGEDGGDGGDFEPTTPYEDVCGLLTTEDVATAIAAPGPGAVVLLPTTADTWARICEWYENDDELMPNIELVLQGALTDNGRIGLEAAFDALGDQREDVAGIGERAVYWVDTQYGTLGLYAMDGGRLVGMTSYFVEPPPTKEALALLVSKALGQL